MDRNCSWGIGRSTGCSDNRLTGLRSAINFKTAYNNRPLYAVNVDYSPEKVARGQYLLENVMACGGACHSPEDGPPYSGVADELSLGPAFVYFAAPNLTPDVETGLGRMERR
jgi:hypothetical protein